MKKKEICDFLRFCIRKAYIKVLSLGIPKVEGVQLCGNENYGGWKIITRLLSSGKSIVYSFGVGFDLSFSEDVVKKLNCNVFAFDPTPKSCSYVREAELSKDERFHFYEYGLSAQSGIERFHLPENDEYVSGSIIEYDGVKKDFIEVEMKSLSDISNLLGHEYVDVLKMDIEGSEFAVIDSLKALTCGQVCIEVHDRFFDNGLKKLFYMLRKMRHMGYVIFDISGNGEEFSFVKKEMIR